MAQLRAKQIKLAAADDILIGGASGNGTVLSKGTAGQVLKVLAGGALGYEKAIAADTTFTPVGTIAATDVQTAIAEVATDAATALSSAIATEVTNRNTAIDAAVDVEETARIAADNALDARIDLIEGFDVADIETRLGVAETDINNLQAADTAIEADIATLQTDLDTAENNISTLQTDLDAAEAATTALTTRVTTAEGDIDAVEADIVSLQSELDATQTGAGLDVDGSYVVDTNANYIDSATSLMDADLALDAAIKVVADAVSAGTGGLQTEVDLIETSTGLSSTGAYVAITGSTHTAVNTATTVMGAIVAVDTALSTEETRAQAAEAAIEADVTALDGRVTTAETDITALEGDLADEILRATDAEADLQAELDATQTGAGLGAGGAYTATGAANYISTATTLNGADQLLDAAIKAEEIARSSADTTLTTNLNAEIARAGAAEDALDARVDILETAVGNNIDDLQDEVDAIEAALGLDPDGTTANFTSLNYILAGDTFKAAIDKLDTALKGEETDRISDVDGLQQQINSLVGLDTMVFKGVIAGDIDATALAVIEGTAAIGDVYRVSSNPSAVFADQTFDVNVGDFVAYTGTGTWVKFDNTDPTLISSDAALVVTGNTFTGFTLDLDRKTLTSANSAITVTGGTDAVLTTASVTFNAGNVNFTDLAETGTPVDGMYLKWDETAGEIAYVSPSELGVVIHVEEDFTPTTAVNAVVSLANAAVGNVAAVFINGVKLKKTGYTVSGTTVTLVDSVNGYGVETGDTVAVSYDRAA